MESGISYTDECTGHKHDSAGVLSKPKYDGKSIGSHFAISFQANPRLDHDYIVFGKLVDGGSVLKEIERSGGYKRLSKGAGSNYRMW